MQFISKQQPFKDLNYKLNGCCCGFSVICFVFFLGFCLVCVVFFFLGGLFFVAVLFVSFLGRVMYYFLGGYVVAFLLGGWYMWWSLQCQSCICYIFGISENLPLNNLYTYPPHTCSTFLITFCRHGSMDTNKISQ